MSNKISGGFHRMVHFLVRFIERVWCWMTLYKMAWNFSLAKMRTRRNEGKLWRFGTSPEFDKETKWYAHQK